MYNESWKTRYDKHVLISSKACSDGHGNKLNRSSHFPSFVEYHSGLALKCQQDSPVVVAEDPAHSTDTVE